VKEVAGTGKITVRISAQAADNAGQLTEDKNDLSKRKATTAHVDWSPGEWSKVHDKKTTADISAVLQEVVNRPGWSARNAVVLLITYVGGGGVGARRVATAFGKAGPKLSMEWAQTKALVPMPHYEYSTRFILDDKFASGEECKTDGSVRLGSSDLELSHDPNLNGCEQVVAVRYNSFMMAQGARVQAATI